MSATEPTRDIDKSNPTIAKKAAVITAMTLLSSIVGLLNQMIFARVFGAGMEMDAYFSLLSVPSAISGAAPVVLAGAIIPFLNGISRTDRKHQELVAVTLAFCFFLFLLLSLFGYFASPAIIRVLGLGTSWQTDTSLALVSRLLWLSSGLGIMSAGLSALHNSLFRFITASFASMLPSVSVLCCTCVFAGNHGILAMAIGMVAAGFLQCAILMPAIFRVIGGTRPTLQGIREFSLVLPRIAAIAVSIVPFTCYTMISMFWASRAGTGIASYIGYSASFAGVVSVTIGYGLATVSLPLLSEGIAKHKEADVISTIRKNVTNIIIIGFAIAGFLVLEFLPIATILFQGKNFTSQNIQAFASIGRLYIVAAVFTAAMNYLRNAYFATLQYGKLALISAIITFGFVLLSGYLGLSFGISGFGIAYLVVWLCLCGISCAFLFREDALETITGFLCGAIMKNIVLVSTVAVAVSFIPIGGDCNLVCMVLRVCCVGIAYLVLYGIANRYLFRIDEVTEIMKMLESFFRGLVFVFLKPSAEKRSKL